MCFLLLASSHTASLVCLAPALHSLYDVYLHCLGVGQCMSCLSVWYFCPNFSPLSTCPSASTQLHFYPCVFPLLSSHNLQKSFTLHPLLCACVPLYNCLYFGYLVVVQCSMKCAVCYVLLCSFDCCDHCLWAYMCFLLHFWVFSVRFELHLPSVLSCMYTVVSRPQWRTSWRRRCQRREDVGGFHGGGGTATPNQ